MWVGSGVGSKAWKLQGGYAGQPLGVRADEISVPIAVKQGDAPVLPEVMLACLSRQLNVAIHVFKPGLEDLIIRGDEFMAVICRDQRKIADHPAGLRKLPIVSHPNEAEISGEVWEEGELPAANCPERTLAGSRTLASQQAEMRRRLVVELTAIACLLGTFVSAPGMPQGSILSQVFPFGFISHRHSGTDITTEGYLIWIKRCTHHPAIQRRCWFIE